MLATDSKGMNALVNTVLYEIALENWEAIIEW